MFAIAHYQKDRRLAAFWWSLCDLKGAVPFFRGRYAIAGLRGFAAPDPLKGGFRTDVAMGLVKLSRAIEHLAADSVIPDATAEEFFLAVSYHTVAACPPRSAWRQLFARVIEDASDPLRKWLRKVLPELDRPLRVAPDSSEVLVGSIRDRTPSAQLEDKLAKSPQDSLPESEGLVGKVREFAERSGGGKTFAWVLCALSRGIRPHDPQRAAEWAETATNWDIVEPRTWTHSIKALEIAGEIPKALSVAWDAVERFPENASYLQTYSPADDFWTAPGSGAACVGRGGQVSWYKSRVRASGNNSGAPGEILSRGGCASEGNRTFCWQLPMVG